MAGFGKIDFNQVHATNELLPAGMYQAIITSSGGDPNDERTGEDGLVSSRSGKGRYLPMTFEIIDGDYKGRKVFKNFNLENTNEQAVKIAQGEIKELLQAIGWDFVTKPCGPDDTSEIHMIPITLQISIEVNKQTGDEQNNIKHFKPRMAPGMTSAAPSGSGNKKQAPATPAAPPWVRKQTAAAPAASSGDVKK
jgi:hypothetical protein